MEKCVDIMDCAITSVVDDLCKHGDPGEIPWKPLRLKRCQELCYASCQGGRRSVKWRSG